LGVHYQTAYRWVRSGQLVAVKVGAGYEISEAALARFQAQRSALERVPDPEPVPLPPRVGIASRDVALHTLDRMVDAVSIDASPVIARAARLAADVLGDAVIVTMRGDDGELRIAQTAHPDPVTEVCVASVVRALPFTLEFANGIVRSGRTLFLPQVPQRDVRRHLRPELHEHLLHGGCFSLIGVPVSTGEELDGTFAVVRDRPGRPYDHDDVEFAQALADHVGRAHARSARYRVAALARKQAVSAVGAAAVEHANVQTLSRAELDELLEWGVAENPQAPVALLDLELRHLTCSKPYVEMLGRAPHLLHGVPLTQFVDEAKLLEGLHNVLDDKLDYRTVQVRTADAARPFLLHAAMVRRPDATPWCVVVVADATP
jgi:excisionase family DNA binding protein